MNDTDRQSFTDALDELYAFYEAIVTHRDFWWTALSPYPIEQVSAGFAAHIADPEHGNYLPKPAHIIKHIERLYPKRTGCYKPYEPEPVPDDTRKLPLNYELTPLYWQKYDEGFQRGLRGPQLARWAREQAGVKLIVGDACRQWLDEHADDALVKRAMLLAQGKGSAEDKSDHLQELIRMVKGMSKPLPYDKSRREEEVLEESV